MKEKSIVLAVCLALFLAIIPSSFVNNDSTRVNAKGDAVNYESGACKSYLASLTSKINNNWFIVDGNNRVTITCLLESDGSPMDVNTSSNPSSDTAQQAANAAFVKAQPFGTLPVSAGEKVKLTVKFISNASPHGDSSRDIQASLSSPNK